MLFGGETAHSYYEEGLTAAMKGDVQLAVSRFKRALELDTQLHSARHQLGKCYLRLCRPQEALTELRAATKLMPTVAPLLVDTGYALLLLDKVEEARNAFSNALQVKSDDPRAIMGLARCAAAKEQWGTVVGLAQHALEQGYAHFDARLLLARAADKCDMPEVAMANYSKAVELMDQSIDANPEQPAGHYLRGCVYFYQENYSAALADFEAALEKAERDAHYAAYQEHFSFPDILNMKGMCLRALGHDEQAREIGRELLALAPDHPAGQQLADGEAIPSDSDGKGSR